MKKQKKERKDKKIIEDTIDQLTEQRKVPMYVFVILLVLYLIASGVVNAISGKTTVFLINGLPLPLSALAGVVSSFANICIIFMAV